MGLSGEGAQSVASLGRDLITSGRAVCASSTDRYPTKASIIRWCHVTTWSDPSGSETLIYNLASQLCLITELHGHPHKGRSPIYSSVAVRFHMGYYSKDHLEIDDDEGTEYHDEMYVWTYSSPEFPWTYGSPEFPMAQENFVQEFKLPKPILCIGGILKVELLGRLQTQAADGSYDTCIDHVQAFGLPLSRAFKVEMIGDGGKCTLKYQPSVDISETESSSRTSMAAGPLIDDYDSDNEYLN